MWILNGLMQGLRLTVVATLVALVSIAAVPASTAQAARGNLTCDSLYSVDGGGNYAKKINPTTGLSSDSFKLEGSSRHNQLGIGTGGAYAIYTATEGSGNNATNYVYNWNATTDTTSKVKSPVAPSTHGAINPANGWFYYGGLGDSNDTLTLHGYNPATPAVAPVKVMTVNLPGSKGRNGDLAFDAGGNMYVVAASNAEGGIWSVDGPMPTTGSVTVTGTQVTALTPQFASANSIAFGPDGYLYVGSSAFLRQVDPSNGQLKSDVPDRPKMTDMASCSNPVSIKLDKDLPAGRFEPTDQFGLEISGAGLTEGTTAVTDGPAEGVQTASVGPVLGLAGQTYTVTETAAGTANFANYDTSYKCVDDVGVTVAEGTEKTATFTPDSGRSVSCRFTNTAKKPNIKLVKDAELMGSWAAGQKVKYSFTATNTGNQPLTNVAVEEVSFSGSGTTPVITCDVAELAVGAEAKCSAEYTLTQADIDTGSVLNAAKAVGTSPEGVQVEATDDAEVKGET
ncbi:hypothetical protein M3E10_17180, partial [Dietzia cinnamea]|nr:hypothetical protein [Dietzia cinnamea]MCT2111479.1 hypothetical protein [Dietzia cinnamea]